MPPPCPLRAECRTRGPLRLLLSRRNSEHYSRQVDALVRISMPPLTHFTFHFVAVDAWHLQLDHPAESQDAVTPLFISCRQRLKGCGDTEAVTGNVLRRMVTSSRPSAPPSCGISAARCRISAPSGLARCDRPLLLAARRHISCFSGARNRLTPGGRKKKKIFATQARAPRPGAGVHQSRILIVCLWPAPICRSLARWVRMGRGGKALLCYVFVGGVQLPRRLPTIYDLVHADSWLNP